LNQTSQTIYNSSQTLH